MVKDRFNVVIGILAFIGFVVAVAWVASQPTYYHVKCYSAGTVILDEDIGSYGLGATKTLDGVKIIIPDEGCIWLRK